MSLKDDFVTLTQKEYLTWKANVRYDQIDAVSYYVGRFRDHPEWKLEYNVVDRQDLGAADSIAAFENEEFAQSLPDCQSVLTAIQSQTTTANTDQVSRFQDMISSLLALSTTTT